MKSITIEIRYEDFNNEWHADICLDQEKMEYIASNNLVTLMEHIKSIVISPKVK